MTRKCDNCEKTIPLGAYLIEVRYIGVEEMVELFKCKQLDFCTLLCLIQFWSKENYRKGK